MKRRRSTPAQVIRKLREADPAKPFCSVADPATRSPPPLQSAAGVKQKSGRQHCGPATRALVRECGSLTLRATVSGV